MKTFIVTLIALFIGLGGGIYFAPHLSMLMSMDNTQDERVKDINEPLYWVAPMDPNYQRDQPGQSPMGMDLIPVYKESSVGEGEGPGSIKIESAVINNLGVRTAAVENRLLRQTINTVGYVQFNQDSIVHIHPRVEGWVEKLYVKAEGEPVTKGQALYDLYSPQLVTAQEELLIASNRKNNYLITAAKERLKSLQLSNEFIERLIKDRKIRQRVTFYSPQSGVLDNLTIREGFFVKPGTTMMSISSLDEVWVEAEVFERQASLIKIDMPVEMNLDYKPSQKWQGSIDYIYPSLDAKTRTLRVRLRFDNADNVLKPNMFTRIRIDTTSSEPALVVPSAAVIRTGTQDRVVLSLGDGRFKSIAVALGQHGDQWIEILDGVDARDTIVTSAQFLLDSESSKTSDFMRMQVQEDDSSDSAWVAARVVEVMADTRMVTLNHEPIPDWNWPSMIMPFSVSSAVNINKLYKDQMLHVEVTIKGNNDFVITQVHIPDQADSKNINKEGMDHSSKNHSEMNHSEMKHGEMDDSTMNHGEMKHEEMDHSTMNHSEMKHGEMDHSTMNHGEVDHSQHQSQGESSIDVIDHSTMKHQ
jgi:Cu(I)/Ag(I) efflux system membrane fusion protein